MPTPCQESSSWRYCSRRAFRPPSYHVFQMPSPVREATGIATRFASFVLERSPFALAVVREVADACGVDRLTDRDVARIEAFRASFRRELRRMLDDVDVGDIAETTPG